MQASEYEGLIWKFEAIVRIFNSSRIGQLPPPSPPTPTLLRRLRSARILILVVILTSNGSELALNDRWDIWKNTTKRKIWCAGSDVFL